MLTRRISSYHIGLHRPSECIRRQDSPKGLDATLHLLYTTQIMSVPTSPSSLSIIAATKGVSYKALPIRYSTVPISARFYRAHYWLRPSAYLSHTLRRPFTEADIPLQRFLLCFGYLISPVPAEAFRCAISAHRHLQTHSQTNLPHPMSCLPSRIAQRTLRLYMDDTG